MADKSSCEEIVRNNKPLGASGTDVVGRIQNADDHVARLTSFQAAEIYDKMRRSDPQVRKILTAITAPIKAAKWSIPPVSEDKKDIEVAALLEQIIFKDINWGKFIGECMTFVPHGFSAFEVVHRNVNTKAFGQYTSLAQLGFRRQATITEWHYDRTTGHFEKLKQISNSDIQVNAFIPAENLLLFFNEQEGDNIGFPICRILYGPWKRKLLATELQYIGMERNAINSPVVTVPAKIKSSDAEYKECFNVLAAFTSAENQFLMIPQGWEIEWSTGSSFDPAKFEVAKRSENEAMSSAIIATFLELGIGGNAGANALSVDLSTFFQNALTNIADVPKDVINCQLIPSLVKLNFGDTVEVLPEIMYAGIDDNVGKDTMEIITGYAKNKVITVDEALEDHVRDIHNLPKKAEGTQLENQVADATVDPDPNPVDENALPAGNTILRLAETVGHNHTYKGKKTGPAVATSPKKHIHELLDADGNVMGRTKKADTGVPHVHVVDEDSSTGPLLPVKLKAAPAKDPKKLMEAEQVKIVDTIQRHMGLISEKYIADTMREYKNLSQKNKINATKNVTIGGQAKFRRELQAVLTRAAVKSLESAQLEVPGKEDVRLKDDEAKLFKEFGNYSNVKLNEHSKLPRRIQLLIVNQANLISAKEAADVTDVVAFQFFQTEGSTNDPVVIRQDLDEAAARKIAAGTVQTVAQDAATLIVNQTRQDFFFDPEVLVEIASFTYINFDPKAPICVRLAGTTVATNDAEAITLSPGFHQNCKTYMRANLKTSAGLPDITGIPGLTDAEKASITLKDC